MHLARAALVFVALFKGLRPENMGAVKARYR